MLDNDAWLEANDISVRVFNQRTSALCSVPRASPLSPDWLAEELSCLGVDLSAEIEHESDEIKP